MKKKQTLLLIPISIMIIAIICQIISDTPPSQLVQDSCQICNHTNITDQHKNKATTMIECDGQHIIHIKKYPIKNKWGETTRKDWKINCNPQ